MKTEDINGYSKLSPDQKLKVREYVLGLLERFNIPEENRDFREEPHTYPSCDIAFATTANSEEDQPYNRGYVFGTLDKFKIPEEARDFRSISLLTKC
jgi:hypothetical protein